MPALLYLCIQPRGLTLWVTSCPCLTYLLPPLAMWDLFSLPPRSVMSEFACRLHCKSSVAALAPVPLCIMDFALYELHLQIIRLEFCWHWLPHSLGVMYLHLWENTFPFFPQGVFRVFVSGRYTSNQCQPITGLSKVCA